jgi:hypothetical protein
MDSLISTYRCSQLERILFTVHYTQHKLRSLAATNFAPCQSQLHLPQYLIRQLATSFNPLFHLLLTANQLIAILTPEPEPASGYSHDWLWLHLKRQGGLWGICPRLMDIAIIGWATNAQMLTDRGNTPFGIDCQRSPNFDLLPR